MKISVVIPSSNEASNVDKTIDFIKLNSNPVNIEEIIIVEACKTKPMVKVAEKSHAKLYVNHYGNRSSQMEIGAFQAQGDVLYFIKPGYIPPISFDERILKYVQEKSNLGHFDYDISSSDSIFTGTYKKIIRLMPIESFQAKSFFIMRKLYYETGGLKKYNTCFKLKKETALFSKLSYLK
jgi:glycosyltransferase involved in cell wall biosynthesis